MKILAISNLYPPLMGGMLNVRCQMVTDALRQRGHRVKALTSNHGMRTEQRDEELERRLWLNDFLEHERRAGFGEMKELEVHNHAVLQEVIEDFQPELILVFSLSGLSKSLIFGLRRSQIPTVYDIEDHWLSEELKEDPWLKWWNGVRGEGTGGAKRVMLELSGQRSRLDEIAPTRLMRGYDRLPMVFGSEEELKGVAPNSIGAIRFDRIFFCSPFLKNHCLRRGFMVNHGEIIFPGVDTQIYYGEVRPEESKMDRLLLVSRLDARSGAMTALEALMTARKNGVDARLTICGRGDSDYFAKLKSYVLKHQLQVEFATLSDEKKELPHLFRTHEVYLHTAEWDEPFALMPLRAMACGMTVISTQQGGAGDILRHGENAMTYSSGDSLELASRIQEMQMQPILRMQISEAGMQEVQEIYNDSKVMDNIEEYLNQTLAGWDSQLTV